MSKIVKFDKGTAEWEAQEAAYKEMWNNELYPEKVRLNLSVANGMTYYRELSPLYFEVLIDEKVDWKDIHEYVLHVIEKHFEKLEGCGYGRLPIRYIWRGKYFDEVEGPW